MTELVRGGIQPDDAVFASELAKDWASLTAEAQPATTLGHLGAHFIMDGESALDVIDVDAVTPDDERRHHHDEEYNRGEI